jgi:hypothetical protein
MISYVDCLGKKGRGAGVGAKSGVALLQVLLQCHSRSPHTIHKAAKPSLAGRCTLELEFASSACSSFQLSLRAHFLCFDHDVHFRADNLHGHRALAHSPTRPFELRPDLDHTKRILPSTDNPHSATASGVRLKQGHTTADAQQDVLCRSSHEGTKQFGCTCVRLCRLRVSPCGQLLGAAVRRGQLLGAYKECHNVGFFIETDSISNG